MKRTTPRASLDFIFRFACSLHRELWRDSDVRIQGWIESLDALEHEISDFDGRDLSRADEFA